MSRSTLSHVSATGLPLRTLKWLAPAPLPFLSPGGAKLWLFGLSLRRSRQLEYHCDNLAYFIDLIRKVRRRNKFIGFLIQRPGDLVYIPPLCTHAVLTYPPKFRDDYITFLGGSSCFTGSMLGQDRGMSFIWR